jgi:hypothetical protein
MIRSRDQKWRAISATNGCIETNLYLDQVLVGRRSIFRNGMIR